MSNLQRRAMMVQEELVAVGAASPMYVSVKSRLIAPVQTITAYMLGFER